MKPWTCVNSCRQDSNLYGMNDMNKDQKRWFKRLKKCLSEMPEDSEISVCIMSGSVSNIYIHNRGDIKAIEHQGYDRMQPDVDFSEIALSGFLSKNVIANSECV